MLLAKKKYQALHFSSISTVVERWKSKMCESPFLVIFSPHLEIKLFLIMTDRIINNKLGKPRRKLLFCFVEVNWFFQKIFFIF